MVKITNGIVTYEVTSGAFENIYKAQGYKVVEQGKGAKKASEPAKEPVAPEKSEDEQFLDEMAEKPLSQWSKTEVKRYAELKDIDITGTRNIGEAKEIIQAVLEG